MSLVGKVFAILSLVLAVFYTGITVTLVSYQENYRQKLVNEEQRHKNTIVEKDTKYNELTDAHTVVVGERDGLRKEIARVRGEIDNLNREWAATQNALRLAMAVIEDQKGEIQRLSQSRTEVHNAFVAKVEEAKRLLAQAQSLNDLVDERNTSINTLQQHLTTERKNSTTLSKERDRLFHSLDSVMSIAERIKRNSPGVWEQAVRKEPIDSIEVIRGKVTGVDQKLGLVIINQGQLNNVKKRMPFIVFRGSKYVGKVIVDEVFPDVAAARYERPMAAEVEVGDDVTTKLLFQF